MDAIASNIPKLLVGLGAPPTLGEQVVIAVFALAALYQNEGG